MVHTVWDQLDHPSGLGRNPVKFWHWVRTLQATTPYPGPLFIPKQDRGTSFMIPNHPEFWKADLVKVGFPPFWHPFRWFPIREMGQSGVSDQLLGHFTPFLLQWYFFWNVDDSYKKDTNQVSGWWDMREWWWKIGFTPRKIRHWSPSWQHSSSGAIYLWVLSLIVASPSVGPRGLYSIHIYKVPPLGASVDPLW